MATFDTHAEIATQIRRETGLQEVVVRWPTDAEWMEYRRNVPIRFHHLGRGMSESEAVTGDADMKLYNKIRIDGSPDLQPEEAEKLIGEVARCDVMNVDLSLDEATVDLVVCNGFRVKHTLRIPSTAETVKFKRAHAKAVNLPHGRQIIRTNLQAGGDLWAQIRKDVTGYANGSVPILHQDAAVLAVITACDNDAEALKDEDF